jgi:hypothetical protein
MCTVVPVVTFRRSLLRFVVKVKFAVYKIRLKKRFNLQILQGQFLLTLVTYCYHYHCRHHHQH